ncbi:GNAT family N-acetyltransferase [Asticcacaulis machinosus]|uniref:GNAT family N-acetyltransferase n=1 Tax=Asticcacaulis machinosus TaxID=2984211 RepID=A0ABT5HMB4_9CAUL|nr:GNAT family N-acetyltransferase [Asticcacaulis machinosus]MDC7677153.1 GNAT family N-acetyltransferase [Asticcacaulis machinosus]
MKLITTERLILTPMTVDDFEPLCTLWQTEDFVRDITRRPLTPEEVWMRLLRDIGHWQVFGYGNWAIRLKDKGDWIGSVGIFNYMRDIEPTFDAPEMGWGLDPAYHGHGYAREAVNAVLGLADGDLALERSLCMISHENESSRRLARKAGFRYRHDVTYHGEIASVFERLRPA